jgi:hypothetical protein
VKNPKVKFPLFDVRVSESLMICDDDVVFVATTCDEEQHSIKVMNLESEIKLLHMLKLIIVETNNFVIITNYRYVFFFSLCI